MRQSKWGRFLGVAIAVVVILEFLPAISVRAAGQLHEEYVGSYSGSRVSQNEIDLSGSFKFVEGGTLGINNLICTATVKLTLSPDSSQADVWWVDHITYSGVKVSSGSCQPNSNSFIVSNSNKEVLATFTNTYPTRRNTYSFFANTQNVNAKGQTALFMDRNGTNIQANETDVNFVPIISFDQAPQMNIGAGGGGGLLSSTSTTGMALAVDNYGSPGASGMTTYESWFGNVHQLDITIDTSTASVPPPFISLPADPSAGNRPALKFIFDTADIEGSVVVNNHKWLLFSANQVDSAGNTTPIPGLYVVSDDDANNNYFLYAPNVSADVIVSSGLSNGGPYVVNPPGGLSISTTEINNVFNYIMDVPKNGTNDCKGVEVWLTGPSSPDGQKVTDIQKKPNVTQSDARLLNASCFDKTATGWPAKWGVSTTNNLGGGACSITGIFALGDIGSIFNQLTQCLFDKVFVPIVTWAADLVKNAAGVSFISPADWSVGRRYIS